VRQRPDSRVRLAFNVDEEFANGRFNNRSRSHMNKDRIEGTVRQAVGSVKEAAGKVLENTRLQSEGKIEKAVGKVQTAVGDVKETLKKSIDTPR
jgi:uncharacterized protein YjbJ (UPF0337 family)